MAVASAMVTARSGSPRVVPTAETVAALAACSGLSSYVRPSPPPTGPTTHRGAPLWPERYCRAR